MDDEEEEVNNYVILSRRTNLAVLALEPLLGSTRCSPGKFVAGINALIKAHFQFLTMWMTARGNGKNFEMTRPSAFGYPVLEERTPFPQH